MGPAARFSHGQQQDPGRAFRKLVAYTSSHEQLVKPRFDRYAKETGVKTTYLTDKAPLLERMRVWGSCAPKAAGRRPV